MKSEPPFWGTEKDADLGLFIISDLLFFTPCFSWIKLADFWYKIRKIEFFQAPSVPNLKSVNISLQELPRWLITQNGTIPIIQNNQSQQIRFLHYITLSKCFASMYKVGAIF